MTKGTHCMTICPQGAVWKSRRSFMIAGSLNPDLATKYRTDQWTQRDTCNNNAIQPPKEALPNGIDLPRKDWVALNRAWAMV